MLHYFAQDEIAGAVRSIVLRRPGLQLARPQRSDMLPT
jgi:hypothetical protein